jgi:sec-independent protein translocase protein TatA
MMSVPAPIFAIGGFGGSELLIILAIVLLLFGGSKLPGLAKGLGQSIKEFKKAAKDTGDEPHAEVVKPAEVKKSEPANTPGSN